MPPRSTSRADIQRFFAERASELEDRFPEDAPRYQRAVRRLRPPDGGVVLDAGCGSGRALALLREAVGPHGQVIGLDLTWQMLSEARRRGRGDLALLVQGDLLTLPLRPASIDGVFAAGLMPHLTDPAGGLLELARVTRRRRSGHLPPRLPSRAGPSSQWDGGPRKLSVGRRDAQATARCGLATHGPRGR